MEVELKEVEQKIGRNVLLFQVMEALLKGLLANNIEGYPDELERRRQKRISSLGRQPMGTLIKQFNGEILSSSETEITEQEELTGIWISFGVKIENDTLKDSLSAVVSERNTLIHHFLSEMEVISPDGMRPAIEYLDKQYEKAHLVYKNLIETSKRVNEVRKAFAAYLASEAGQKHFDLLFVRGLRVMGLLCDFAREKARSDGWAELSIVEQIIRQEAPEELATLKAAYKQKTLKGFLLETEGFEIYEEPTSKGGVRVLYREKTEQTWQITT